ncbi:hypothetical protein C8F01DRAFT_193958 [Mycena amicta]|nr:hypothetical protein C8F01DRAFT_193958 [Mycena amicta]
MPSYYNSKPKKQDPYANVGVPLHRVPCRSQLQSPPTSPSSCTFSFGNASSSLSSDYSASASSPVPARRPHSPPAGHRKRERERVKVKEYPSAAVDLAIRGVSTMLLIPMPFLESVRNRARKGKTRETTSLSHEEHENDDDNEVLVVPGGENGYMAYADYEPNALKRLVSLKRPSSSSSSSASVKKTHKTRNSLVLPHVPVPSSSSSVPPTPAVVPSSRDPRIRATPPPCETRAVRFSLDAPPNLKPRRRTDLFEVPDGRGENEEPAWSDFM